MLDKNTFNLQLSQQQIAGMDPRNPNDVEFFGIRPSKTVQFLQAGRVHYFEELSPKNFQLLQKELYYDDPAQAYFKNLQLETGNPLPHIRKVELYTYYLFGDLDHTPDIKDGILQRSENFRDTFFCPSLQFSRKDINMDDYVLTERDLVIIQMSALGIKDEAIAEELSIAVKTLDSHKTKLFKNTGTQSKLDLITKAYQNKIIQ